ncbi:unnamed protein product, partial [Ectocarpus sp. 12 AP-2014]
YPYVPHPTLTSLSIRYHRRCCCAVAGTYLRDSFKNQLLNALSEHRLRTLGGDSRCSRGRVQLYSHKAYFSRFRCHLSSCLGRSRTLCGGGKTGGEKKLSGCSNQ